VVPVGVRGQQADDAEAGLLGDDRQSLDLGGKDGRVQAERLLAVLDQDAVGLPRLRRDDDDVAVEGDDSQWATLRSRGA
jgi:hypothetical protein